VFSFGQRVAVAAANVAII